MGVVGPAAAVGTAITAIKGAADLAVVGANADLVAQRFDKLAQVANTTGEALLGALRKASGGEISDLNLQLAANRAQLLGVASGAEELGVLMSIARNKAQELGLSSEQAFNDLIVGLGRGSVEILDNLAITVSAKSAYDSYATSIGKSANELDAADKKQAIINATIAQGKADLAATGGAIDSMAGSFAELGASAENAKNKIGELLAVRFAPVAEDATKVTDAIAGTTSAYDGLIAANDTLASAGGATFNPIIGAIGAYNSAALSAIGSTLEWMGVIGQTQAESDAAAAALAAFDAEMARSGDTTQAEAAYQTALANALAQSTQATNASLGPMNAAAAGAMAHAVSAQAEAAALAATASALAEDISKKQQSEIEAQKLAQIQTTLAALGPAVAGGLQSAASAAAFLATRYGFAYSEALKLVSAQAALAGASAAKVPMAGITEDRLTRDTPADRAQVKSDQALAANRALLAKLAAQDRQGGSGRVAAAGATADKLASIENSTGDKIASIVADTQSKITAITQREAAKQAAAIQELNNKIATSAADRRASAEADDLDLIAVDDSKEAARLNDRERAQAKARESEVAAAKEAQDAIANGEAESASKVYDIREKQIGDQQQLDEKYAERQRELAGNEDALAALQTQYDEGTRANEEAAATRIAIAKAESEQKKAEVQAEKDAVIAAANEQANQVISAAERSAQGVTRATQAARDTATANLRAIGDAVNAIPANKTITISVNQQGTVGASSSGNGNKAAGGGTFVTTGQTTLTVGDNPGGRELVTVTPLSGTGRTSISGGMVKLAGGGVIDAGGGYTTPIAGGPPAASGGGGGGKKGAPAPIDPKKALDEMKNTIQMLMDMARLKEQIASLAGVPAFDIPVVQALVNRAQEFTAYVASHLIPITKAEGESLGRYLSAAKDAASMISDMASLKKDIAELKDVPAFDQAMVLALVDRAEQFTKAVQGRLIPLTEFERDQISRYASVVGDTISILSGMADLKKELAEIAPPIDTDYIWQLVADAALVTSIMRNNLIGTTEEQADAVGLYAAAASDTVSILSDVLDLRKNLAEGGAGAISDQMIIALADQAMRITELVGARLIPATEEQGEAVSLYADVVGSSVSALKDVAGLTSNLFTDYTSPTDAQIALLATDAQRMARGFFAAASTMDTKTLEAAKLYTDAIGGVFTNVKDGLEVFDRLRFSDISVDPKNLALLHDSSVMVLDTVAAIGKQAAMIPAGDIAAMNSATGAIKAYSEAMVTLAAVPFGNLPTTAQSFAGAGLGGGGSVVNNYYNTFNLPPGTTQQIADVVIQRLNRQTGTHR